MRSSIIDEQKAIIHFFYVRNQSIRLQLSVCDEKWTLWDNFDLVKD